MQATRIFQIAAFLVAIFVSGLATGVMLAPRMAEAGPASLPRDQRLPNPVLRAEQRLAAFTQRLHLSPEQQEQFGEVLRKNAAAIQRLNAIRHRKATEVVERTSTALREFLNEEQQAAYDRMKEESRPPRAGAPHYER